jgi:hypothetical protein
MFFVIFLIEIFWPYSPRQYYHLGLTVREVGDADTQILLELPHFLEPRYKSKHSGISFYLFIVQVLSIESFKITYQSVVNSFVVTGMMLYCLL